MFPFPPQQHYLKSGNPYLSYPAAVFPQQQPPGPGGPGAGGHVHNKNRCFKSGIATDQEASELQKRVLADLKLDPKGRK